MYHGQVPFSVLVDSINRDIIKIMKTNDIKLTLVFLSFIFTFKNF